MYTYDLNSRLSSENYPGQGQTSNTYDWVGNKNPGTWTYNAADQLTSDGTHSYGYDYNGNLTTVDSTSTYTYTYTNLLSTKTGGTSMLWDASENRVRFTSSTDQSYPYYFVYDATAGIPAVIEEVHDGDSVFYVREPYGSLICRIDGETTQYYGFDELGNTLFLTASNGTVSDKYTYDAWGNVTSHTGSTSQPYQYIGRLGYYTHWQDSNMGDLLQLGVRFYVPGLGRFTQRDPIRKHEWSPYIYSDDCVTRIVDPSGRDPVTVACILYLAYKTATTGWAVGNGIIACYYLYECNKCLKVAEQYTRRAKSGFKDPLKYEEWLLNAKPALECAELCKQAGERGIKAFWGLVLRILPHACRCKPPI